MHILLEKKLEPGYRMLDSTRTAEDIVCVYASGDLRGFWNKLLWLIVIRNIFLSLFRRAHPSLYGLDNLDVTITQEDIYAIEKQLNALTGRKLFQIY